MVAQTHIFLDMSEKASLVGIWGEQKEKKTLLVKNNIYNIKELWENWKNFLQKMH